MGNKANTHIHTQFIISPPLRNQKKKQTKCRHCTNYKKAENISRMAEHLLECEGYKATRAYQKEISLVQQGLAFSKQQLPLAIKMLGHEEVEKRHMAGAYAAYCGGRPFSIYEEPYMYRWICMLDPAYKPPTARQLSSTYLEACYKETRLAVLAIIASTSVINLITDESSTVARDRVINLCMHTPRGPFYIKNALVPTGTSSAERQAAWILRQLDDMEAEIGCKLPMINSTATDTCNTMRKLWRSLRDDRRFAYTFFVPCDSHGIQLLINDIINMEQFKPTIKIVNEIVAHFRCAHKQLALLRDFQKEHYSKTFAFVLSAETRWGTYFYSLQSLHRVKEALKAFARCPTNECGNQTILNNVLDPTFWSKVDDLIEILRPINQRQLQSESTHSHLGRVEARWREIRYSLTLHTEQYPSLLRVFDARMPIQVLDIHLTAFRLDPLNVRTAYAVGGGDQARIIDFLRLHTPPEQHEAIIEQYLNYKSQYDNFLNADLWGEKSVENPVFFWSLAASFAPELAAFARRLFRTPSNSVPSERAFSAMKLNSGKNRATMKLSTLDMLCFIHINRRVLDRGDEKHHKYTRFYTELTDEQALRMEDELEGVDHGELLAALNRSLEIRREEKEANPAVHVVPRRRVDPSSLPLPSDPYFFQTPHYFIVIYIHTRVIREVCKSAVIVFCLRVIYGAIAYARLR